MALKTNITKIIETCGFCGKEYDYDDLSYKYSKDCEKYMFICENCENNRSDICYDKSKIFDDAAREEIREIIIDVLRNLI